MNILANGKPRSVDDGATIADFLDGLGWKPEWVVVEYNGEPLERRRVRSVVLRDGDRLEVVRAVSGGSDVNRVERLRASRLYLCTDGRGGGPALDAFLDAVLGAGVDVVQLREKRAGAVEQLRLAAQFRAACDRHGALFVLNDRVDLAVAAGADGVHLGRDDLPPEVARAIAGMDMLIGRSTHSVDDITRARSEPADYIAVGPVHETPTKPGRPAVGLPLVEHARDVPLPWFAIGGINETNIDAVMRAGATRIAVVRALTLAEDPALAAKRLRATLDS